MSNWEERDPRKERPRTIVTMVEYRIEENRVVVITNLNMLAFTL